MDAIWTIMLTMIAFWVTEGQVAEPEDSQAVVEQFQVELPVALGGAVTFQCSVKRGVMQDFWMSWYKEDPEAGILWIYREGELYEPSFQHGYRGKIDAANNLCTLEILRAETADAGLYYCALQDVGSTYTKALIFGQGTQLTVLPQNQLLVQPSVFVLRSDEAAACLVKDFYPKQAQITMTSTSGRNTGLEPAATILSSSGKYSAVQVAEFPVAEHVRCTVRHEGAVVEDQEAMATPKEHSSPEAAAPKTADECEATSSQLTVHSSEKVNTLSLTVMGLRILFAKSLAFNLLLSARFFLL